MADHSFPKYNHFTALAPVTEHGMTEHDGGGRQGEIPRYSVSFCNEIPDSTGHEHHVCQREVEVTTWFGQGQAIAQAIVQFEALEDIASWKTHAGTIECTLLGRNAYPGFAPSRPQP